MNRIEKLFKNRSKRILSIYFTAGFPNLEDTLGIMSSIQDAGADIIEIGIPYSDPIADGPTIQESNQTALNNGMSLKKLFGQLETMRNKIQIPVILMGYLNPIIQFGFELFCQKCKEVGVDGLILPDLPMQQFTEDYKEILEKYDLRNTFLISPQTSEKRIREIDRNSNGFIYMVSSHSITGAKPGISEEQVSYFENVQKMGLKNPRLIGFGISDRESFSKACLYAEGAIIGSAFIHILKNSPNLTEGITAYIKGVIKE